MAGALGTTRPWRPARGKIEKPRLPGRSCSRENKEDFVVEEDYPPKEPCSKFLHGATWKISQALQDVRSNRMFGSQRPKHKID